jgi:hypothetical protein
MFLVRKRFVSRKEHEEVLQELEETRAELEQTWDILKNKKRQLRRCYAIIQALEESGFSDLIEEIQCSMGKTRGGTIPFASAVQHIIQLNRGVNAFQSTDTDQEEPDERVQVASKAPESKHENKKKEQKPKSIGSIGTPTTEPVLLVDLLNNSK